ncbi:hypothetical protein ASE14_10740 [Agromyces sp. Root81]|uniref:hypothetical protein n=1 Tax=Agromyces sp. Root81 TaxID=1736601 RepID=UPI0006FCA7EB|nr:hypothetical protein [Agromyces sp. Root81]KRC61358.1 hypothetical protein ASE14_10740 [Agromyces sp. Root81]
MTRARIRTALGGGLLVASLAFGLTACGTSPESLSADLHASVVQVAERAEAGDHLGAIAALALLDRDVTAAVDAGTIGAEQAAEIREAIALVQADLEAAIVADTPSPTPAPDDDEEDDDNRGPGNNNGNGNKDKKHDEGDD